MIDALIYVAIGIVACAFAGAAFSARVRSTVTGWFGKTPDAVKPDQPQ